MARGWLNEQEMIIFGCPSTSPSLTFWVCRLCSKAGAWLVCRCWFRAWTPQMFTWTCCSHWFLKLQPLRTLSGTGIPVIGSLRAKVRVIPKCSSLPFQISLNQRLKGGYFKTRWATSDALSPSLNAADGLPFLRLRFSNSRYNGALFFFNISPERSFFSVDYGVSHLTASVTPSLPL